MDLEDKLGLGVAGIIVGGFVFAFSCTGGCWGSRGIKTDLVKQYKGRPLLVQHEDRILNSDPYWIMVDNREKITKGGVVSDDGKLIEVPAARSGYSVTDYIMDPMTEYITEKKE